MKRSELNEKVKAGLKIDEDRIIVINGKTRAVLEPNGAEFDLDSGTVMLKYQYPAKQRNSKAVTVQAKGGKK